MWNFEGLNPHDTYSMAINTLTDAQCRQAKPQAKPYKLFDGGGLFLFVSCTGSKIFRVAYRLSGKQQTISLGAYPLVSLSAARIKRDTIKASLLDGDDPMAPRRAKRATMTLEQATEQYWGGRHDISTSYMQNVRNGLAKHLAPLNPKPIASIGRDDLLAALMVMNAVGHFDYVRKVRVWAGQVFDWAVEQGHCKINPAALIRPEKAFGHKKHESHAALPLAEVGVLFARIDMEGQLQSVLAAKMLALTWLRTGELRMLRWSEIEGDVCRIPKGKMKRRREHLVPLPKQALELLAELRTRTRSDYEFPGARTDDKPMSENAVLYLLGRCGFKHDMTGHGFRTVASTWANEAGYNRDWIERQLAHAPDDKVRAAYNQAQYLPQRKAMLQDFADWLDLQQANAMGPQG